MNLNSINEFVNEFTAGRPDFLDAINDNSVGSLDFGQLEALINSNSSTLSLHPNGIYPDSPPDSGSEPYSPNYNGSLQLQSQNTLLGQTFPPDFVQSTLIEIENNVSIDEQIQTNTYQQQYLINNGLLSPDLAGSSLSSGSMVAVSPSQQHSPALPSFDSVARLPSIIYPHTIPSNLANNSSSSTTTTDLPQISPIVSTPSISSRKRKCTSSSESDEFVWKTNSKSDQEVISLENEIVAAIPSLCNTNDETKQQQLLSNKTDPETSSQTIKFQPFQQSQWALICDQNLQESTLPAYRVDADKGFNFSIPDDAFVCQKKNHFQITCHVQQAGVGPPVFVTTKNGLEKILEFELHFYGVKLEAPSQQIRIEQSQPDRTKKAFNPVKIDLRSGRPLKLSIGRLHFSETTANNMRKKGRPNPDQRYFQLVIGLHAQTHSGHFPIVSMGSERIIVRASNPGQFDNLETSLEMPWAVGENGCIYHNGMVGINMEPNGSSLSESLVVNGNIKVSGQILANSDIRAKQEICELDSREQLKNIQKIRVVRYRYEPDFATQNGLVASGAIEHDFIDTGVIAQEIQKILPDAVKQQKGRILVNGEFIEDFLLINKDRIFMENIGAIKELCKLTGSLENRIQQLERINSRLSQRKESTLSRSPSTFKKIELMQQFDRHNHIPTKPPPKYSESTFDYCSNKMIQAAIVALILIILASLSCLSTLYFVEHRVQPQPLFYMTGLRGANGGGGGVVGSDINSIQKEFLPKMNGKYYTFAPHLSQAINSNHKSASHDNNNIYFKNQQYDIGQVETDNTDGVLAPKQKKTNESKSQGSLKMLSNKTNGDIKTAVYIQTNDKSDEENTLISEDSLLTLSKTVTVQEIGLTKQQQQCLSESNNNIDPSNPLCANSCNSTPQFATATTKTVTRSKPTAEVGDTGADDDDKPLAEGSPSVNQSDAQTAESEPTDNDNILKNLILRATEIEADLGLIGNQTAELVPTKPIAVNVERPPNLNEVKFEVASKNEVDGQQSENLPVDEIENHSAQYLEQKKQNVQQQQQQQLVRPEIPPPVQQQNSGAQANEDCNKVILRIKADFNLTLGVEEICLRREVNIMNITYLVPVSKFMKEAEIELQFLSPNLEWVLCSSKQKKINEMATEIENSNFIDSENKFITHENIATAGLTKSIYPLTLPLDARTFEKYLVFRTIITSTEAQESGVKSTRNICDESPKKHLGHYLQYNIKLYRDC